MIRRELAAAGIIDPRLRASYDACRRVNARHGRTYFLATLLLPPERRPAVHALYGFARHTDDIVDAAGPGSAALLRERLLDDWVAQFHHGGPHPLLPAVFHTVDRYRIPQQLFADFLAAMRSDLTVSEYPTYDDLLAYTYGSAAVIGLQLLPVLGTRPGMAAAAEPYARDLGVAFQLTNFIRDVGEDLRRGRIYLPKDELAAFGVSSDDLHAGVVDSRFRRLLAYQIARARELIRSATPGIRLLDPGSRDCVGTAVRLYGGILDAVERADYRVLDRRVAVGSVRRVAVAGPGLARAARARHRRPR